MIFTLGWQCPSKKIPQCSEGSHPANDECLSSAPPAHASKMQGVPGLPEMCAEFFSVPQNKNMNCEHPEPCFNAIENFDKTIEWEFSLYPELKNNDGNILIPESRMKDLKNCFIIYMRKQGVEINQDMIQTDMIQTEKPFHINASYHQIKNVLLHPVIQNIQVIVNTQPDCFALPVEKCEKNNECKLILSLQGEKLGCRPYNLICSSVISYAKGPDGVCKEFSSACIPSGWKECKP